MDKQPLLSILICTVEERKEQLKYLLKKICDAMLPICCEVITDDAPRYDLPNGITVGEKRQRLLEAAKGKFIWFLDDDDDFTPEFIRFVLGDMVTVEAEVICAKTKAIINGKPYIIDTSIHYQNEQLHDGEPVKRYPSVMNVYNREVALRARFQHINNGEDFAWSMSLNLKTQYKVDEVWHIYNYDDTKTIASKA